MSLLLEQCEIHKIYYKLPDNCHKCIDEANKVRKLLTTLED